MNGLISWIDKRFPLIETWDAHLAKYYAPRNFNFLYLFGSLALLVLVNQILTGVWLTMNYKTSATEAFGSVEYIMRDVDWGWLIRYMHSTGASAFFIVVYMHMFRGLIYGSHKHPRELIWLLGMTIYLALMAEAFMGYLLPWGQMSFWGAQVIINLFEAIPWVGPSISEWIRGDYVVSDATLNRFAAFHVILLPLLLVVLVFLHIVALHKVGSNNPDGVEIKANKNEKGIPVDGIPFHPYYTVKDIVGVVAFLILFALVIFFAPTFGNWFLEKDNFIPANPLATPEHIVPLWYFTPYYAILRAVPSIAGSAFPGVAAMGLAIVMLFLLPWFDRNPVKSIRYREPLFKGLIVVFVVTFLVLGYLGTLPATAEFAEVAFRLSEWYFAFFFILVVYSKKRISFSYIMAFVSFMTVITAIDFGRYFLDKSRLDLILTSYPMVLIFFAVFLLWPAFSSKLTESKRVPERVTH